MGGCWRPVLKILGGRKARATAVGRSARACARASARFPYDRWGRAGAGGGKGIPRFLAFEGLPDLGVPIPPLSSFRQAAGSGVAGDETYTPLSARAPPRVFWVVFWFFFFGFTFPTLEI